MPVPTINDDEETQSARLSDAPAIIETATRSPLLSPELHQTVWRLAWPSVTTMLLQTVNSLLDLFFVGHLPNGKQALAATGSAGGVIFLLVSLAMGISVGTTALVARFTGAEQKEEAVKATAQSLTLSLILGLSFGIPMYLARDVLAGLMLNAEASPEAVRLCGQFLAMALLASVPMFLGMVLQAAFRGLGDTRTPLYIMIATVTVHISLNFLLIRGNFGFPALGVQGAGIALASSLLVSMLLSAFLLYSRSTLKAAFSWELLAPRRAWFVRILRIGIPASIQAVVRTASMMVFTRMLANTADGAAAVGALQIGIRSEAIAFMPGFGYSMAAAALVGQNLGAKKPERAEQSGWAATMQAMGVMCVMAVIFFVFADPIARTFTSDPLVQKFGADYLRINAFCEPFLALGMVLTGALQGAGETSRPTLITIISMVIVRMPLAYFLMFTLNLQTHGAWLSMAVTTIVGGLLTLFLFRAGTWKKLKV
jgi:putative MATE family efflux protein